MNFRDLTAKPHSVLTPAEMAEAHDDLETMIATGWDQDFYGAQCDFEEAEDRRRANPLEPGFRRFGQ